MSRILSPYGVKPIELKKHLNNIGFDPQKITIEKNNDFLFVDYNIIKKENKILEENLCETYNNYKCDHYKCDHYNCNYHNCSDYDYNHYDCDEYNKDNILKEDLQNKINYSTNCLIDPFDNGDINYDEINDDYLEDDNNSNYNTDEYEEYGDYYDDYAYRRKY